MDEPSRVLMTSARDGTRNLIFRGLEAGTCLVVPRLSSRGEHSARSRLMTGGEGRDPESDLSRGWCEGTCSNISAVVAVGELFTE